MLRPLILAGLTLLGLAASTAATAAEPLRAKVFFIPLGTDPPEKKGAPLTDARGYLKENGIQIPPDGEATFDRDNLTLTVRAPQHVIEQIDKLVCIEGPIMLRVELDLIEFTAPSDGTLQPATYQHLREIAGDSWKVIHRTVLDCESGRRIAGRSTVIGAKLPTAKASSTQRKASDGIRLGERAKDELLPNETGAVVEVEPVVGPTAVVVDLNVQYHYRGPADAKTGATDIRAATGTTLRLETPVVLQSLTHPAAAGQLKELALIASVYLVTPTESTPQRVGGAKTK